MKKSLINAAIIAALTPPPVNATIAADALVKVAGRYKIEAVKADGSRRLISDWFENLIVDQGLNRMGTGAFMDYCRVGTGSTSPANSDTQLVAQVASTNTIQSSSTGTASSAPYYGYFIRVFRFGQGAAAGNLTEVGVGWAATGATLFSRALIKDGGGSPTTITVLSDEFLDVTYEFRSYAPTSDSTVPVTISATSYTFTIRAANVTSATYWSPKNQAVRDLNSSGVHIEQSAYNGSIGAVTAAPSGSSDAPSSVTTGSYSNNSYQADITVQWDLNSGNLSGGISALLFGSTIGGFQLGVSPVLLKTSVKLLTLVYRVTWARH